MTEHPIEKLAFTIDEAARATGFGASSLWEDIKAGLIETRKRGRSTVILRDELARYLNNLPRGRAAA